VAYNVTSVNGTANSYRSDGVDLEACTDTGCGDDIGWTAAGQWFKYTVNVAAAGTYTASLRLASPSGVTDGLHIASSSGANLSGIVNVPATGGWQTWTTVTATVTLPAGKQTLTIDQDNGGWNIHQLTFASSTTPPANTVTVSSPGNQTGTVGTAASLQVSGTDSASGQTLAFSATGLPAGLSISSSGLISGTPTTAAKSNVTVTAADTTGAKGSASFTWTVSSTAPPSSSLVNGGFETGSLSPWVCQAGDTVVTAPVHSGTHAAVVSATNSQTGECDQTITLSPNTTYTLSGWTEGNYAYIGVNGGATASTWTSSSGWAQQTVSFTTGSSGTVTVFVHGWYAQGNVYADDFSVT
jgi:chitinase